MKKLLICPIIIFFLLSFYQIVHAEDKFVKWGITFTRIEQSEFDKESEKGQKIKIKRGDKVYNVKRKKIKEEGKDTRIVWVDTKTNEEVN